MSDETNPNPSAPTDSQADADNDHLAELLRKREHAKPNRWTWALLGVLVLAVGFLGGAFVGKRTSDSGGSLPDFSAAGGMAGMGGGMSGGFPSGTMPSGMPTSFPGDQSGTTDGSTDGSTDAGSTGGSGAMPGGGFGGGMTMGTVSSVGDGTLVITDMSGNEVTVTVSGDTSITKQADVSLSDLAVGSTVVVRGETGDDGSVTAQSISEGGGFGGMPGGGMPGGGFGGGAPGSDQGTDNSATEGSDQ